MNDADFIEYCSWLTTGSFYTNLAAELNQHRNDDEKHQIAVRQSKSKQKSPFEAENLMSKKQLPKEIVKVLFQIYLNGEINGIPVIEGYGNSLIADYMKMKFGVIHQQIIG